MRAPSVLLALLAGLLPLLPGLLVVRAPWTAVPALSLAFWTVSAFWLPASTSRLALLHSALGVFAALLVLRLVPKHEVSPPPGVEHSTPPPRPPARTPLASAPSLLVLAAAIALCLPALRWRNAPGPALAFQTAAARLVLWRDGAPRSMEPLLPAAPFGAHAPAIASLAADLSALSGLDPARAVAVVLAVAVALTVLGFFALTATRVPPPLAALASVLGLALVPWPGWVSIWGAGEALLALAFLLPAIALLVGHETRSSAVAAGLLCAAASLAQPLLTLCALAAFAVLALVPAPRQRCGLVQPFARGRLAVLLAGALAGPGLWPLASALSLRELVALAGSLTARELAGALVGLAVPALVPWLLERAFASPSSRALQGARGRWLRGPALALAFAAALGLLLVRFGRWGEAGQLAPDARARLERAAERSRPLDVLCAPPELRDWLPAIAARAAGKPGSWTPPAYRDEWGGCKSSNCIDLSALSP